MSDEPTLGEVARVVLDIRAELRALRGEVVAREVYAANREADHQRLAAVEAGVAKVAEDRTASRRMAVTALFGAVGLLLVNVVGWLFAAATRH